MFEIGTASDYRDLLAKLNTFLTAKGSAFGLVAQSVTGGAMTGNGTLTNLSGQAGSTVETWIVNFTDATHFTTSGYASGTPGGSGTVGTPYSDSYVSFLITAGSTPFTVNDMFQFNTTTPWTALRSLSGAVITSGGTAGGSSGPYSFENLIDGKWDSDNSRMWQNSVLPTSGAPRWVQFDFPAARTIREYQIQGYTSTGYAPKTWTFDYWTGSAWATLDTQTTVTFAVSETKTIAIGTPVSAARYRINFTDAQQANWYVNRIALRDTVGSVDVAHSQYMWQAPGNDGTPGQVCGVHAFTRGDVPYFDWEIVSCDGWTATLPFFQQTGIQRNIFVPLANSSIPYWFIADGRRVIVVAKVAANYEMMYLGYIEPFFTPTQWPYPAYMGGSLSSGSPGVPRTWDSPTYAASQTGTLRNIFTHSDSYSSENSGYGTGRVRKLDGSWLECWSRYNGGRAAPASGWVWPWCLGVTALDTNLDGSYMLLPAMLLDPTPNALGQLSGISFVSGKNLTPEDTITVGPLKHLAVPNVYRTTREDFIAVRLD